MHPNGLKCDGSLSCYADDIFKKRIIPENTALAAAEMVRKDDAAFDEKMAEAGYCQNKVKRDIVPCLRARGQNRELAELIEVGNVVGAARYIGALYAWNGASARELSQLIRAVVSGWKELGSFWVSRAPFALKRSLFIGQVVGAAQSAGTALLLTDGQCARLDGRICKHFAGDDEGLSLRQRGGGAPHCTE